MFDYISTFSGIGAFEIALEKTYKNTNCLFYSEIDKHAIKVYTYRYPSHINAGNIDLITEEDIVKFLENRKYPNNPVLIFGGFPCTNLSSMSRTSGDSRGLQGKSSSLFYTLVKIIKTIKKYTEVRFVLENNLSMSKNNRKLITETLEKYVGSTFMTKVDATRFGVQRRRRLFWTNFEVDSLEDNDSDLCVQTWDDILVNIDQMENMKVSSDKMIKGTLNGLWKNSKSKQGKTKMFVKTDGGFYKYDEIESKERTRMDVNKISDTINKKSVVYLSKGLSSYLVDRRFGDNKEFLIRQHTVNEIERLFMMPDGWVDSAPNVSFTKKKNLLGRSIVVGACLYVFSFLQ